MSLAQVAFLLACHCASEADSETESLVTSQNVYNTSTGPLDCLCKQSIASNPHGAV